MKNEKNIVLTCAATSEQAATSSLTFAAASEWYFTYCREVKNLAELSIKSYAGDLRVMGRWIAEQAVQTSGIAETSKAPCQTQSLPLSDTSWQTQALWREYFSYAQRIYSIRTVHRKYACISGLFEYLCEAGYMDSNPLTDRPAVKIPRVSRREQTRPKCLSEEEVRRILAAADSPGVSGITDRTSSISQANSHHHPKLINLLQVETQQEFLRRRDCAILYLLIATGLRVQELCSLTMDQLERGTGSTVTLYILGKGSKKRTSYISDPVALQALDNYLKMRHIAEKEQNSPSGGG